MAFNTYHDDAVRSVMARGRAGFRDQKDAERARTRAATVTQSDLFDLGIPGAQFGSADAVDPDAMKFDAMMALKRAQQSGMPTSFAQKQLDKAEMAAAGRDEVLRRRQQQFNEAGRTAQVPAWAPYGGGGANPTITAQTGAAMASQARAGRFQDRMPTAQREFTDADARRAIHFSAQPMAQAMRGLSGARGGY